MIPEPARAVDKSAKVRSHPRWKLFVKRKRWLTLCESFSDAWTEMPCHRLAGWDDGGRGRDLWPRPVGRWERGHPRGSITV